MRLKLILAFILISISRLLHGQNELKISFFCPDDWEGELQTQYIKTGITYLGIYESDKIRQESMASLFTSKDSVIEGPWGPWRKIVIDSISPTFVVSGLKLTENTIIPGIHNIDRIFPGESIHMHMGANSFALYATGEPILNSAGQIPFSSIKNYKLILRLVDGKNMLEQVLVNQDVNSWPAGGYEGGFWIRWIGDLNDDNTLDILLTTSSDYRGWENILYLGVSDGNILVKEVGRYTASGE